MLMKSKVLWVILLLSLVLAGCASGAAPSQSWASMTVDADRSTVYVAAGLHLYAVNTDSGTERWRFPTEVDNKLSFYAAPALTPQGELIAGGYNGVIYSLNPASGQLIWQVGTSASRFVAGPAITSGKILAASSDHTLYVMDLQGKPVWQFTAGHALWGTPAVNGELVYLPALDHHIYGLRLEDGKQLWATEDLKGAIVSAPALGPDGQIYFGTLASELIAAEKENGAILWRLPTSGWVWGTPLLADGTLYFGDLEGTVYAVNAADGTVKWSVQPVKSGKRAVSGTPLLLGDTLYFASEGGVLYAVDAATGNPRWNKPLNGRIYVGPQAVGDTIIVALYDAEFLLMAFDPAGNQKWTYTPAK